MARIDIREIKKKLRAEFKESRRAMKPEEKERKDLLILEKLTALPEYRNAKLILTYVSTNIEVDTHRLIARARQDGKRVAVPRCASDKIDMTFYEIDSLDELSPGCFGVLEPDPTTQKAIKQFSDSICVLPGLGFDLEGYRLGYGKGYYDRFLSKYPGKNLGISYNICMKSLLPHGRYDKMVDILVTEKFVKRFCFGKSRLEAKTAFYPAQKPKQKE